MALRGLSGEQVSIGRKDNKSKGHVWAQSGMVAGFAAGPPTSSLYQEGS